MEKRFGKLIKATFKAEITYDIFIGSDSIVGVLELIFENAELNFHCFDVTKEELKKLHKIINNNFVIDSIAEQLNNKRTDLSSDIRILNTRFRLASYQEILYDPNNFI